MTSPPAPPNRRRRWLGVVVILVLVSLVTWWHWPRGDARFVGKWSALIEGDAGPYGDLVFLRNDRSRFYPTGYVDEQSGTWRGEHNRLIMAGKRTPNWGIFQPLADHIAAWMGSSFMVHVDLDPLEIVTVAQDEIRLINARTARTYVLRRIPE